MPRSNRSLRQPTWLALLVAAVGVVCSVNAAGQSASLGELKAAFLFNFSKFIEWPDTAFTDPANFTIGVIGDDRVVFELNEIVDGKKIGGRNIALKHLATKDNPAAVQILYIGAGERSRLPAILLSLQGKSVLTVSDLDQFCAMGGMIQFQVERDRMRFDVNIEPTGRAGLTLNSKLLALARTVIGTKESGAK